VLLTADELQRFPDLRLRLSVNGEVRQDAHVGTDMIYSPLQALQSLARFHRQAANPRYLQDGDVIEAGVATDDGAIDLGTQRTVVRWAR
jgi:2-keto-4-pentenoate hydratase/2-oxohepta-3-ene-1,7-dioic acid hydratase in catechol pathway